MAESQPSKPKRWYLEVRYGTDDVFYLEAPILRHLGQGDPINGEFLTGQKSFLQQIFEDKTVGVSEKDSARIYGKPFQQVAWVDKLPTSADLVKQKITR